MRKVSIPKVSLNYIFLSPFREHEKQTLPKFKGKFADNSTANGWWYNANSPNGPKISLAAHVDEETKNFELYELSETPFFNNNDDLENIAATGNYGNVADMRNMFSSCSGLTSLDLSNFDTSSVTDMAYMFSSCSGLTSLNLSGWDLSKVTGVGGMFNSCSKLTTITGPITGITQSIDLMDSPLTHDSAMVFMNGLNTATGTKTITFKSTTYKTLTEAEIAAATAKGWTVKSAAPFVKAEGNWAQDINVFTSNKIDESQSTIEKVYFKNLGGKTITISYDVDSEIDFDYLTIFALDSETETIATSKDNGTANGSYGMVGSVDFTFPDDEEHFICFKYSKDDSGDDGRDNAIVTFPSELFGEAKWVLVGEVIRYEYEDNTLYKYIYQDLQLSFNDVLTDMHKDGELISKEPATADIISPNDTIKLNDTPYEVAVPEVDPDTVYSLSFNSPTLIVFGNPIKISSWEITTKSKLTEIRGLNLVDTSNVTNMNNMFYGCSKLTSLDLSNFDTSSVTNMGSMFGWDSNLTSLDLSNFDTSSVTDMAYMFGLCSNLTSLDVSGWDVSKVTNMSSVFSGCSKLTSLDVSNFNTSSVTNMAHMFSSCSSLTSLDVSNFNTPSVTNMGYMFTGCNALTSLDVSNFDTSSVTNMNKMFYGCRGLTSLDLSNFDTSSVTDMNSVFGYCQGLTSLDLSNFNTSSVTNMSYMFSYCSNLTSLDLSNFNTSKVTNMREMFSGCSSLTSLNLSGWNLSKVTYMDYMFGWDTKLTTITGPITGISEDIDLKYNPLTHDSAMVFMNGLNTVTETKTITFKSTTYKTLTEVEIAAATAKGWTVASE